MTAMTPDETREVIKGFLAAGAICGALLVLIVWRPWRRYHVPIEPKERPKPGDFRSWKRWSIATRIEPDGTRWRWTAHYTMNGRRRTIAYSEWWHPNYPHPYTVTNVCATQAEAQAQLSAAVNRMRSRIVAAQAEWDHRQARGLSEVIEP